MFFSRSPSRSRSRFDALVRVLDRRAFIRRAARSVLAFVGCHLLHGCTAPVRTYRARPEPVVEVPVDQYPELDNPGGMVKVLLGRRQAFFVRREGDGKYVGISAVCTHQGCIVDSGKRGFNCPCHGSVYDSEGINIGGPAPRPLERLPAERESHVVKVHLPKR